MEDKIPKIIKKVFKAKTLEITRITEGFSHFMYLVRMNKEPKEIIVRFSNNTRKDSNIQKEKYIIEVLRKNKIPAPKIYAIEKEYMIIEKFGGERLDLIWDSLSRQEKIHITEKIGKLTKALHKIKLPKFGKIEEKGNINSDQEFKFRKIANREKHNLWIREFLKGVTTDLSRLASYEHISKKFLTKFSSFLFANLNKVQYEKEPTLIHGDLQIGHFFVKKIDNEYKIIGIIDFEFAHSYAPEYDFIKLHRQGFFDMPELKKALLKGYGKIDSQAVEFYRVCRDLGFAQVILDAGNKELSDKVIKDIEYKLNKKTSKNKLSLFSFP